MIKITEKRNDTERLRRENRSSILLTLRNSGPLARIELGAITGLSLAAITTITKDLLNEELLHEVEAVDAVQADTKRGRPRVLLDINGKAGAVIAVSVTAGQFDIHHATFRGDIISKVVEKMPLQEFDGETFDTKLADAINRFAKQKKISRQHLLSIGISMQGTVDSGRGTLDWSPVLKLRNHNVIAPLEKRFKCPVKLINDANAIALSLRARPENQQLEHFACVMLGLGVGAGLFIGGRLYHGYHGAAGEFGHIKYRENGLPCRCGQTGCVEAYTSEYALCRDFMESHNLPSSELSHPSDAVLSALDQAARDGDKALIRWYQEAGKALAYGLCHLIQLFSPEKIIISGTGARSMDLMEPAMNKALQDIVVAPVLERVDIVVAPFHEDLVVQGTVKRALASFYLP